VLVDDRLGGTTAPTVVRAIMAARPTSVAVVMVDETAISVAREAVLSGARGFVLKPLAAEDFWATVYQVLTQHQEAAAGAAAAAQEQGGKVIAFVGSKGGTGRTMSAVNTAISLHRQQKRSVVIVDADYAAPAVDVMLNLEGDKDISLLLARLSRLDQELIDGVLAHHSSGIRVLLAPPPGQGMPAITMQHLEQVVGYLRQMFDWVIVDLGAANGEADYAFLDFADQVVVVTLPEMVRRAPTVMEGSLAKARPAPLRSQLGSCLSSPSPDREGGQLGKGQARSLTVAARIDSFVAEPRP
jgi:pilus assembly protein CpaE